MKKQSNLSRLLEIAGSHKYLTYASWVLSAISALIALVPFYYIWKMIKEVLEVAPNFGQAQSLTGNGWMAVLFAVIAVLVYIAGLMCSHLGAFRIATNLRIQTMEHIVKLPLGFAESFGSGKLRKIVNESSAATETYLAHQLPDRANAIATPCGLLVLLFVFDWRLGLLSLVPVVLGFLIMMAMTGKQMQEKMKEYQNALDDMSNEAVEYVRGIPVVKTFGQTIFSFKKFKDSIDRYKIWVIAYTKQLRTPMMFYTAACQGHAAISVRQRHQSGRRPNAVSRRSCKVICASVRGEAACFAATNPARYLPAQILPPFFAVQAVAKGGFRMMPRRIKHFPCTPVSICAIIIK